MNQFSVVGINDQTGETFLDHVEADNSFGAMRVSASSRPDCSIVCAIPGHLNAGETIEFAGEGVVDSETVIEQDDVFC